MEQPITQYTARHILDELESRIAAFRDGGPDGDIPDLPAPDSATSVPGTPEPPD